MSFQKSRLLLLSALWLSACGAFATVGDGDGVGGTEGARDAAADTLISSDAAASSSPISDASAPGCEGRVDCERVVFVSRRTYASLFDGGARGADEVCTRAAVDAGVVNRVRGRSFMAWLSDADSSPEARFVQGSAAYVDVTGATIASDWAAFASDDHALPISRDERGEFIGGGTSFVWTATLSTGKPYSVDAGVESCSSWSDVGAGMTMMGDATAAVSDKQWSQVGRTSCRAFAHLYCVEK